MAKYFKRKSYWKTKCDTIFSKIVRQRANNRCEETGSTDRIQCAHIVSRSYHAVRWDFDNAVALSASRHFFYTHHPVEWRKYIGNKRYAKLEKRALNYRKWTLKDLRELYEKLCAKMAGWDEPTGRFCSSANPGRSKT